MPDDPAVVLRAPEQGETLGQYLRAMRREQRLSWDHLVKMTPASQSAIRKIELGLTPNPGIFTILPILRTLHLPVGCLLAFQSDESTGQAEEAAVKVPPVSESEGAAVQSAPKAQPAGHKQDRRLT